MTQTPSPESVDAGDASIFGPRRLTQALVLVAIGICAAIFVGAARWLHVPAEPKFQGSLLQSPTSVRGLLAALVLLGVCAVIGDFFAGRRWYLAGLFVATAAFASWSIRAGTMQQVLFRAQSNGSSQNVFVSLLIEHLIFMAAVAGLWSWLWSKQTPVAVDETLKTPADDEDKAANEVPLSTALFAQTFSTMLILLILLIETSAKKQVLVSVFVACMSGTAIAQTFFKSPHAARFYWLGPLVAGVVGYAFAYFQPVGLEIGHLNGFFAGLARPLPLDYASLGCAGALFGYWANTDVVKTGSILFKRFMYA